MSQRESRRFLRGALVIIALSLAVAATAQEPEPPPSDEPVQWDASDPRNVVDEGIGLGRVMNRDDNDGGLLPGGSRLAPCANPTAGSPAESVPQFWGYYCDVADPQYKAEQLEMRKGKGLEGIAADLNGFIRIPSSVALTYRQCGQTNAFYVPASRTIVLCYELIDAFYSTFERDGLAGDELDDAVQNATTFAFYHELGHALIHVLDLPVTGKEEDAVDQLATYVVSDGSDANERTALDGAVAFLAMSEKQEERGAEAAFWDEHALGEQRFFNIICWVYGDSPEKYQDLVADGTLPKERAAQCGDEWRRVEGAWTRLLSASLVEH